MEHHSVLDSLYPYSALIENSSLDLDPEIYDFIKKEQNIPVYVKASRTLRAKVNDDCGMACNFCHNEGTPVSVDNKDAVYPNFISSGGKSGRVSVFADTNGVRFTSGDMQPNSQFRNALQLFNLNLGLNELHLTGGEPTLHPKLADLVKVATEEGYEVKLTSNSENGKIMIPKAAKAGLTKVNFSIFGTNSSELAVVQNGKVKDRSRANKKISALKQSIETTLGLGLKTSANIVMSGKDDAQRVNRIIEDYSDELEIRVMDDLSIGLESIKAVYEYLHSIQAKAINAVTSPESSGYKVNYKLPNGRIIGYKQLLKTRLPIVCEDCNLADDCKEGYYGLRLYIDSEGNYQVGVCIQRMDLALTIKDFFGSAIPYEILKFSETENERIHRLLVKYGKLGLKEF